jgi:hypothetical protein
MPDALELRNHIIRHEELRDAVAYTMNKMPEPPDGGEENTADGISTYLLNFFGYGDRLIDNVLSSEDRDMFYMCEETGLLKTEREEETLLKGSVWRIHYWILNKANILRFAHAYNNPTGPNEEDMMEDLYKNVGDEAWQRNGTEAHT